MKYINCVTATLSYRLPRLTMKEKVIHKNSTHHYYCHVKFDNDDKRIAQHNHANSQFIAGTCLKCNSKIKISSNTLKNVFHYVKGYDSSLF